MWGIKSMKVAGGICNTKAPPTAALFRKLLSTPLNITVNVRIAKFSLSVKLKNILKNKKYSMKHSKFIQSKYDLGHVYGKE